MRFTIFTITLSFAVFAISTFAAELPSKLSPTVVGNIVRNAPPLPEDMGLDLKLRLIDFIDCTDENDPHEFMDQSTSKVVDGSAGRYRITAAHRHAFFSYRFKSAGKGKPILIVYEYPDDADRVINFSTHESVLSGRSNSDWSLETGVYTGTPLPVTNKMQYHSFIMYPTDKWPIAMVGNFARNGRPAAASRIWIYRIQGGLPKLEIDDPDVDNPRRLGHYNSIAFLPTSFHFGYGQPQAVERMLDYAEYIGVNELSWTILINNSWGVFANIPSWKGSGNSTDHLDKVLSAMDLRGGLSLIAGFGSDDNVKLNDKLLRDMPAKQLKDALCKMFDEFLDNYGQYKSLTGIALGGQYGVAFFDMLERAEITEEVIAHIKDRRPDMKVITFLGGRGLHIEYFDGKEFADGKTSSMPEVIADWDKHGGDWPKHLSKHAAKGWDVWKRNPDRLNSIEGLTVYEQYQPDDHHIFGLYAQQPREMVYYDLDNSQARSDAIGSVHASMWNTHFEGWYGLEAGYNFWYRKLWVAPDFNAPPPLSLASFARVMGHRDRLSIMPGSWNNKYFGYESAIRRFSKAFRSLPPVEMEDVASPVDSVKVRWAVYEGKRYISVQSLIPFDSSIIVDGKEIALPPYELVAMSDERSSSPKVSGDICNAYKQWVTQRAADYNQLLTEVKNLDPSAAPIAYSQVAEMTADLLSIGNIYEADMALGAGLMAELELRKDLLEPVNVVAGKLGKAPELNGDLDGWPGDATDITTADDGRSLAGHLYFPNSWQGQEDLSARIRLGYHGERIYLAIQVKDQLLTEKDSFAIRLSTNDGYKDWVSESVRSDKSWGIVLPLNGDTTTGEGVAGFTYTCTRTVDGYIVEGSASLAELGLAKGKGIGFLLSISDVDDGPNLKGSSWAAKQVLLYPHKPNFQYWSDARNCGELVLDD